LAVAAQPDSALQPPYHLLRPKLDDKIAAPFIVYEGIWIRNRVLTVGDLPVDMVRRQVLEFFERKLSDEDLEKQRYWAEATLAKIRDNHEKWPQLTALFNRLMFEIKDGRSLVRALAAQGRRHEKRQWLRMVVAPLCGVLPGVAIYLPSESNLPKDLTTREIVRVYGAAVAAAMAGAISVWVSLPRLGKSWKQKVEEYERAFHAPSISGNGQGTTPSPPSTPSPTPG